jgi:hypothetical protein
MSVRSVAWTMLESDRTVLRTLSMTADRRDATAERRL